MNNDDKSPPPPCELLPLLLLPDDAVMDDMSVEDDRLDLGIAMMAVMGGDELAVLLLVAAAVADAPLIPSDAAVDQGLITLTHDLEYKSHIRNVPSSDPLASNTVLLLQWDDNEIKFDGSSKARDVTALTCPFNSDTYLL